MEDIKLGGVDTSQAQTSLKQLRESIKAAKEQMLNLEEGTKEYTEALNRAANAQFQMSEINEQVRATAMDLGAVLTNSTRVLEGLAGGYTAFQGILNLLGVENENLQETFVKLQAAMAVVQGLDGIDGMFKSLKNLNIIMKQTETGTKVLTAVQKVWNYVMSINPVFLLITAIAALSAGVVVLTKVLKSNNEEEERANRIYQQRLDLLNQIDENISYNAALMKAQGKTSKEINDYETSASQKRLLDLQREINMINSRNKTVKEMRELKTKYGSLENAREALPELEKLFDEEVKKYEKLRAEKNIIDVEQLNKDEENKQKELDNLKSNNQKIEDEQRKHNEKMLADADKFNQEFIDNLHKRGLDELDIEMKKNEEFLQQQYEWNLNKQDRQRESDLRFREYNLMQMEENYLAMDELDRSAYLNRKINDFDYQQSTLQNRIDYNNKLLEDTSLTELQRLQIENDNAEARITIAELEKEKKLSAMSATASLMGNITNLIGKETAVGKAIAVAQATIDTYVGAQRAYTGMLKVPIVGTTLAPVAFGVAVAAGMKNVKDILKVKIPKAGSGGGSSAISAPSISAPKIPSTLTAVRNVQTESEVSLQKEPIRAYVVESDISKTSDRINAIKKESEF